MRSFACSDALFDEFESRAVELGCSVDWLMAEAMQRLLAETRSAIRTSVLPPPVDVARSTSDVAPRIERGPEIPPIEVPPIERLDIPALDADPDPEGMALTNERSSSSLEAAEEVAFAETALAAIEVPPPEPTTPSALDEEDPYPQPKPPEAEPDAIVLSYGKQRVRVDRDPFVIGRRPGQGVHFVIENDGVSRRHAMLERGENGWVIFDLGSTNGILVNGSYVAGAPLRPGDILSFGPVMVAVEKP